MTDREWPQSDPTMRLKIPVEGGFVILRSSCVSEILIGPFFQNFLCQSNSQGQSLVHNVLIKRISIQHTVHNSILYSVLL